MKLINKIKQTKFLLSGDITTNSRCSIVGNSGCLLDHNYGSLIDEAEDTIRFNSAIIGNYQNKVGSKTTFRILNCHYILNIDNESYYNHQKTRFPDIDRHMLYKFKNENLIFKTDPAWALWKKKHILNKVEQNNNIYFIDEKFYNLGKKLNDGKEPTNGFAGLMFALKYYESIRCFGFSFYKKGIKKHYYDEVKANDQHFGHNFDTEKKWFTLLEQSKIIEIYK